jgi:dynein heavy chain
MKNSLKNVMAEAVRSYSQTKRIDWVLDWPGQVVLAGDLIYWTSEVTEVWDRCETSLGFEMLGNIHFEFIGILLT